MTLTAVKEVPVDGGTKITVFDALGPITFQGRVLVDLSWDAPDDKLRWTDMTLYWYTGDADYQYMLHVVGRSIVYHKSDGPCRRGVRLAVGTIAQNQQRYENLVACPRCKPVDLDDLGDSDTVAVEEDRPQLTPCNDAADVVTALQNSNKGGTLSGLAMRLLSNAAQVDPAFTSVRAVERTL